MIKKIHDKSRIFLSQPNRLIVSLSLLLMMLFVTFLSVHIFSNTSLRLDEAQSLFQTNRNLPGVLKAVAEDVHVPFYHILLHFWQKLFGGDIFTARLMSLIFFLLSIPATYLLGKYAFSKNVGLYAALLIAISPFMNWYGSEARMYSMLAFMVIINQLYFLKIYREGKPQHWLWYTVTAILGMYTHYFFAFVIFTEALFYIMKRKTFSASHVFTKFLVVAFMVFVALAPWLYHVYSMGAASNTQPNLAEPTSGDLFNTYAQFIFGFQIDYFNTIIVSLWPLVVLLAFFALQKNHKVPNETIFFVMAAVVPVLGAFLLSITVKPFYLSRYLIVAIPALFIFISWIFTNYPDRLRHILKTTLVAIISLTLYIQITNPDTPVKENYEEAVTYLEKNASPQDTIVAAAPFTIYPIEYYYNGDANLATLPIWDRFSEGSIPTFDKSKLPQQTKQLAGSYQKVWLILSYDQGYNKDIEKYYEGHFKQLSHKRFSKGLDVYSYQLRYDDPVIVTPIIKK